VAGEAGIRQQGSRLAAGPSKAISAPPATWRALGSPFVLLLACMATVRGPGLAAMSAGQAGLPDGRSRPGGRRPVGPDAMRSLVRTDGISGSRRAPAGPLLAIVVRALLRLAPGGMEVGRVGAYVAKRLLLQESYSVWGLRLSEPSAISARAGKLAWRAIIVSDQGPIGPDV
jgi:hypothetical protein